MYKAIFKLLTAQEAWDNYDNPCDLHDSGLFLVKGNVVVLDFINIHQPEFTDYNMFSSELTSEFIERFEKDSLDAIYVAKQYHEDIIKFPSFKDWLNTKVSVYGLDTPRESEYHTYDFFNKSDILIPIVEFTQKIGRLKETDALRISDKTMLDKLMSIGVNSELIVELKYERGGILTSMGSVHLISVDKKPQLNSRPYTYEELLPLLDEYMNEEEIEALFLTLLKKQ